MNNRPKFDRFHTWLQLNPISTLALESRERLNPIRGTGTTGTPKRRL
ncbi:MAG: hypothetical protein GPI98_23680 [Microcystis aeruginosa W13-13]|nr:hypothetical protein [Microcystis aeruginosa W13-16]NCQ76444.1 hypothetical protein [Microcystis aeruginosa W13-13]NCS13836.1 hypothetical protein [Microcystis aeruginosa G13-09]NCS37441.1 hypothetical protein [Microcystis aeruginosa G11-01]